MTGTNRFTDEQLVAFLDGEAYAATARDISAGLETDASLRGRLADLQLPVGQVKDAFDGLLAVAPAMPEITSPKVAAKPGWIWTAMAASLVVGVALGSLLSNGWAQPREWQDYAAAYHALYVNGTLAPVEASPDDATKLLGSLGEILGHDLVPAQTDTVLQFKRGQLLGYQGHALVQLAYLTPLGEPVALCITRAGDAGEAPVTATELEGMAAAEWTQDGLAFLLIGGTDAMLITDAANRMAARL